MSIDADVRLKTIPRLRLESSPLLVTDLLQTLMRAQVPAVILEDEKLAEIAESFPFITEENLGSANPSLPSEITERVRANADRIAGILSGLGNAEGEKYNFYPVTRQNVRVSFSRRTSAETTGRNRDMGYHNDGRKPQLLPDVQLTAAIAGISQMEAASMVYDYSNRSFREIGPTHVSATPLTPGSLAIYIAAGTEVLPTTLPNFITLSSEGRTTALQLISVSA